MSLLAVISREERLKRKREAEEKRREQIFNDPDCRREENNKQNARNKGRNLSEKEKEARCKKWKLNKRKYVAQKNKVILQSSNEESGFPKIALSLSTQAESMRKVAKRQFKASMFPIEATRHCE